jgi:hypothetical protein
MQSGFLMIIGIQSLNALPCEYLINLFANNMVDDTKY